MLPSRVPRFAKTHHVQCSSLVVVCRGSRQPCVSIKQGARCKYLKQNRKSEVPTLFLALVAVIRVLLELFMFISLDWISGRMTTMVNEKGQLLHLGANWIHGAGDNPIWKLNHEQNLARVQWLPTTYYSRMADGTVETSFGNATFVPGYDAMHATFEVMVVGLACQESCIFCLLCVFYCAC